MRTREAGQVLGGKYRLVARLGGGGMGSVWRAEHLSLSSPVAIKLIEPATAREPDGLHRFLREARTAAALRSPHVVQIFDYGVDGDTPYIVMELLDGESLAERLAREGCLGVPEVARIVQHIARALARAHEAGIVHRDLKPENVFIVKNDDEEIAKVLDFGIVKADPNTFDTSAAGAATRTGTLLGTPYFMSPEQAESSKSVDHRADIWALGVIAYRCLIGELPFTGDSVGRLILEICSRPLPVPSQRGKVPDGFDVWFAQACARDPRARFESAKSAAAALSRLTDAPPVSAEPSAKAPPQVDSIALRTTTLESSNTELLNAPRRPRRIALGLAALALLSLGTAVGVRLSSVSKHPPTSAPGTALEQRHEALEAAPATAGAGAPGSAGANNGLAPLADPAPSEPRSEPPVVDDSTRGQPEPTPPQAALDPAPTGDPAATSTTPGEPIPPRAVPSSAPAPRLVPPAGAATVVPTHITPPPERKPLPSRAKPKVDLGI